MHRQSNVVDCVFVPMPGTRSFACAVCGKETMDGLSRPPRRTCLGGEVSHSTDSGPGTELHKLLGKLGIRESADCGCKSHIRTMDQRGPDWCEENIDTIVGWLRESAEKRGLLFVEFAARQMVKMAIRRARRKETAARFNA